MKFEQFEEKYGHWLKHVPEKEYKFIIDNNHPHWLDVMDKTIKACIEKIKSS